MSRILFSGIFPLLICGTLRGQVSGCTDPLAINFNPSATWNDGSCTYAAATVSPVQSWNLDSLLVETSGLVFMDSSLWSHNDNTDTRLYRFDTNSVQQMQIPLPGVSNHDWEDLTHDSAYLYIGDFGNNANGNRTDLRVFRVNRASLTSGNPLIDTISFSYADQVSLAPAGPNHTDFDCEAFIASRDSLYLFTKQWITQQSKVYALPKIPGNWTAEPVDSLPVQGLVTGATYLETDSLVLLCGYSNTLQPFLYLLYDFHGHRFSSGNKRKLSLSLGFHQTEGIATVNGTTVYLTNEYFSQSVITVPQKLHKVSLSAFLDIYLGNITTSRGGAPNGNTKIWPNPASDGWQVEQVFGKWQLSDLNGVTLRSGLAHGGTVQISSQGLPPGCYVLTMESGNALLILR